MQILKLPNVIAMTGLSRASIYAFIKKGEFPRQVRLSAQSVGWVSSEVEDWIANRIQMRGGE